MPDARLRSQRSRVVVVGEGRLAERVAVGLGATHVPALPDDDGRRARERSALVEGVRAQVRMLVDLVTGPVDFNTAAVRRAVTTLAGDAFGSGPREPMLPGTWAPDEPEGKPDS